MTCDRDRQFDPQALGEIYDCYSPAVYRYAVRLLGAPDLAEECVAEVFNRYLNALRRGQGPNDNLRAYLYRIAHNWITDRWRRGPPPSVSLEETRVIVNLLYIACLRRRYTTPTSWQALRPCVRRAAAHVL